MRKASIFRQLVLNVIFPVIIFSGLLIIFYYVRTRNHIKNDNERHNRIIIDEIKSIFYIQEVSLKFIEQQIIKEVEQLSNTLVSSDLVKTRKIETIDLNKVEESILGENDTLIDIFIIKNDGDFVNSTGGKDLNLNYFDFGANHKKSFLNILNNGVFVSGGFTIEASSKQPKIYTYQPTSDKKYIIEIGISSPAAIQIIEGVKKQLIELTRDDYNIIKSAKIIIQADSTLYSLTKEEIEPSQIELLFKIFNQQIQKTECIEVINNREYHYNYIYLPKENTSIYKYVIQIVTDRTEQVSRLKTELKQGLILFFILLFVVFFVIYQNARRLTYPILRLVESVKHITDGNFNERTVVEGNNEITELSRRFNQMIESIEMYYNNLEKLVKERTQEIQNQKTEIEKQRNKLADQNKTLERALVINEQQKKELEDANHKIKESARLKEVFLANTSHEIRTPLNIIIGYTNLLLNKTKDNDLITYLLYIKTSSDNLMVIINDILDFSKIEADKLTIEEIDFDFYNFSNSVIRLMKLKAIEKSINLNSIIDSRIPKFLVGDPVRLNQILTNLLRNAIKFTDNGGNVSLEVELQNEGLKEVKIQFSVIDTGIGIHKEKLGIIFDSFTQATNETTRKYGGTGLGLTICKKLVEMQGGNINVESTPGKGSKFFFSLNFRKSEGLKHISKEDYIIQEDTSLAGLKLLIVEDNEINLELALETLKMFNPEMIIDSAINGKIAVDKVKNYDYDLILMDIQMPEMDGYEATQYIRRKMSPPKSKIPILGMSAHAMEMERKKCLMAGMNEYIKKPFTPADLINKIHSYSSPDVIAPIEENDDIPELINNYKYIDLNKLPEAYRKDEAKRLKIIKLYKKNVTNDLSVIINSFSEKNFDIVSSKAHTIKSSMSFLGLTKLQSDLEKVEIDAKNRNDLDKIEEIIINVEHEWKNVLHELEKEIDKLDKKLNT